MKIQYASDLHLEFPMNRDFVLSGGMAVTGDILVLAGDIAYLEETDEYDTFWDWCSQNYKHTFIVPGNHEYYAWSDLTQYWTLKNMVRENVGYYNNVVERIGECDLIFSTLWSEIASEAMPIAIEKMPDYTNIRFGSRPLTPYDVNDLHQESVQFIFDALARSDAKKTFVVTHHLPTYDVVDPQYKDSLLTSAFVSELKEKIQAMGPDYWIYGHSHANIEATIGKTKLICNQLGYLRLGESADFDDTKVIEL